MEIKKISHKNYQEILKKIIVLVKKGKILVLPTDTVYGLICDASSKKSIEKIFKIKKRPKTKALPVFIKNIKEAKKLACINKNQEKLLKKVWPGKVTVILKRKDYLPKIIFANQKTIGLRIPKQRLIKDLLEKTNLPLIGTSANLSGQPASTKIKKIIFQFKNKKNQPDFIFSVGDLKSSKPSTIIDLTLKKPRLIRKGDIVLNQSARIKRVKTFSLILPNLIHQSKKKDLKN